jgi:tellurite resistance protein TerC
MWIGFLVLIGALLALDLGVFHRRRHAVGPREALVWSCVWIGLALLFNLGVWRVYGHDAGLEFLTGYLVEKALSVDNLFVFLVIFSHFRVPDEDQHRILFWGILGAIVLRAAFILAGAALIARFHVVLYLLGAFLIVTGVRLIARKDHEIDPERSWVVRLFRRVAPSAPMWLLVLAVVEATDVMFAVDSIPAIFAITTDPFIVFTSNIFAILGLRSLFFLLHGALRRLERLKLGLGAILIFVGVKMTIADVYRIPVGVSLGVIAGLLLLSVVASLGRSSRSPHGSAST